MPMPMTTLQNIIKAPKLTPGLPAMIAQLKVPQMMMQSSIPYILRRPNVL